MAGVLGEEHGLLRGGKAAAHHEHIFAGEKLPVARGAVGHAPALEGRLPGKAHFSGVGPGGPTGPRSRTAPPGWCGRF